MAKRFTTQRGFPFFLLGITVIGMKILVKLLLLTSTLVVVFISPASIGIVTYYMIFPLLFFLIFLLFIVSYWVSDSDVRKVRKQEYEFSLFCGKIPPSGEGDLLRGRMVITPDGVALYQRKQKGRTRKTPCEEVWSKDIDAIESVGFGKVQDNRKGLLIYLKEGTALFLSRKAIKQKEAIIKALGWEDKPLLPQRVEVEEEASSAPSFTTLM